MIEAVAHVRGHVQGVGYRYFCKRLAEKHGLVGFARNDAQGHVEVLVQGPLRSVQDFFHALQTEKPHLAIVENVEMADSKEINALTCKGFAVK